jgi:hypothetical protein
MGRSICACGNAATEMSSSISSVKSFFIDELKKEV